MKAKTNKKRDMRGVTPGRGSAGRVNAGYKKRQAEAKVMKEGAYFPDVAAACTRWLREKGLKVGGFREMMLADIHESMGKER